MEALNYEYTINGRKVRFRSRLPLRESDALIEALTNIQAGKLSTNVPALACIIESWDFPGDPRDPESYQELDTISEAVPLIRALEDHLRARTALAEDSPKN